MPASKQFAQFIALMELVEALASRQTTESLSLRTSTGEPVGRLTVEGGQVRFGIEHRGRVFIDEVFMREQPRLSVILRKILDRHSLARVERDLTWDISAIGRVSLCELTARALRKVAVDCVLPAASLRPPDTGLPQLRLLNVTFTPLELALAAGLWGTIRHEDPAAQMYWSPPANTVERWLFEWQPNDPGFAWPILSDNLATRRVTDVRLFGSLVHLLCSQSLTRRLRSDRGATSAALTLFDEGVCYVASSSRYLTLLVHERAHIGRLLTSFEEFIENDSSRRPDSSGSVLLAGKVALAAGQHAASTVAGLRLSTGSSSTMNPASSASSASSVSSASSPIPPGTGASGEGGKAGPVRTAVTPRPSPQSSTSRAPTPMAPTPTAPTPTAPTPTAPTPSFALPSRPPAGVAQPASPVQSANPVSVSGAAAGTGIQFETLEVRLDELGIDLDFDTRPTRPTPGKQGAVSVSETKAVPTSEPTGEPTRQPQTALPSEPTSKLGISPASEPRASRVNPPGPTAPATSSARETSQEWLLAAAELIDSTSWHAPGVQTAAPSPSSQSLRPPFEPAPAPGSESASAAPSSPREPAPEPQLQPPTDRWGQAMPPSAASELTPPAAPKPSEITGPEDASAAVALPDATPTHAAASHHTPIDTSSHSASAQPPTVAVEPSLVLPPATADTVNGLTSPVSWAEEPPVAESAPPLTVVASERSAPAAETDWTREPVPATSPSAITPDAEPQPATGALMPPPSGSSSPLAPPDPRVAAVVNLGFPDLALLATLPPPDGPSEIPASPEPTYQLALDQAQPVAASPPPVDDAPVESAELAATAPMLAEPPAERWELPHSASATASAETPPQPAAPPPQRSDDSSLDDMELRFEYLPREHYQGLGEPMAEPAPPAEPVRQEPPLPAMDFDAALEEAIGDRVPPAVPSAEPTTVLTEIPPAVLPAVPPAVLTGVATSYDARPAWSAPEPSPSATPLLVLQDFTARIEGRTILKDLSFRLERRGVYAVMGPGGSGKSTLAGILGGQNRQSGGWEFSGRCDFDGAPLGTRRRPMSIPQVLRRTAMSLSSYLRCDLPDPDSASRAELQAVLTQSRLSRLCDELDTELSRMSPALSESEWWRLAIARAVLCDPALLCIDEPTAGLSEREAAPIIDVLKAQGLRRTVMFVTHNQQHARVISHFTMLIAGGRLQELDSSEVFFSGPSSRAGQDYVRTGGCYVPSPDAPAEHLSEEFQTTATPVYVSEPAPIAAAAPSSRPSLPPSSPPSGETSVAPAAPTTPAEVATLWTETLAGSRPVLSLRRYSLRVGTREMLSDVNLDLADRGIYVLAIPDGISKRMLIRALCGPRPANFAIDGQAQYSGSAIEDDHAPVTPQTGAQLLMRSVAAYIGSALAEQALSRLEQRSITLRLIQEAGFTELLDRLDVDMTSVEQDERRVLEILRAAVSNPALLILEDPLFGLAAGPRQRVISVLHQQARQRTLLLLSQDDGLARELAVPHGWVINGRTTTAAPPPPEPEPGPEPSPESVAPAQATNATKTTSAPPSGAAAPAPSPASADRTRLVSEPEPEPAAPVEPEPSRQHGSGPRGFQWLRPGALAGMPAPGLTHDLAYDLDLIRGAGVTHLVTLTQETLPSDELLMHGLYCIHFPVVDMDVPSEEAAADLCRQLADLLTAGKAIGFHCKAGLGRTGTMLACQLIWEGTPATNALTQVRSVEPGWVQSDKQVAFLGRFEDWLRQNWPLEQGQRKKRS